MITPLGSIPGVPEDLIRALNERFRQLSTSSGVAAIAGGRQTRIKSYPASGQNAGDFFVEMDRGNALYQVQVGKWLLVSGAMAGAVAKRPTDLNSGDVGFIYRATDTAQEFRWSGAAWVEMTFSPVMSRAHASANQSLTTATDTALSWDTNDFDVGGIHETVTHPTRFTAPVDGIYLMTAYIQFAAAANGSRMAAIRKNGVGGGVYVAASNALTVGTITKSQRSVSAAVALSAGDYLEAIAFQDCGVNLNAEATVSYASMVQIA
jgi:hypothetical protein